MLAIGYLKFVFVGVLICSDICDASRPKKLENVVEISTEDKTYKVMAQRFYCSKRLTIPVDYFSLNVTLSSSAYLAEPTGAVLTSSSPDKLRHYLTSPVGFYSAVTIEVEFTLIFNNTPLGNCSFCISTDKDSFSVSQTFVPSTSTLAHSGENQKNPENTTAKVITKDVVTEQSNKTSVTNTTEIVTTPCLCPCQCTKTISKEIEDAMITEIINDLTIPKSLTSSSKRKLSSATDMRLSSKSIGIVGAFVLTIVFGGIFVGDTKLFLHHAKMTLSYLKERVR